MLRWGTIEGRRLRCIAFAWAIFAIVLKVGVPPGFMLSGETRSLVPCPSQFSSLMPSMAGMAGHDPDAPSQSRSPGSEAPCTFSAHGAAFIAAIAESLPQVLAVAYVPAPRVLPEGLAPGQDLVAPPLPARGPPSVNRIPALHAA